MLSKKEKLTVLLIIVGVCFVWTLCNVYSSDYATFKKVIFFSLVSLLACLPSYIYALFWKNFFAHLAVASWITKIILTLMDIRGAESINLTRKMYGYYVFVSGEITPVGYAILMATPLGFMAVCSTLWFLVSQYRNKTINK